MAVTVPITGQPWASECLPGLVFVADHQQPGLLEVAPTHITAVQLRLIDFLALIVGPCERRAAGRCVVLTLCFFFPFGGAVDLRIERRTECSPRAAAAGPGGRHASPPTAKPAGATVRQSTDRHTHTDVAPDACNTGKR